MSKTDGHWMCMFKDRSGKIQFYDSYGNDPNNLFEENLSGYNNMPEGDDDRNGDQLKKFLMGKRYGWNPYRHQKDSDNIMTCGWHCMYRLLHRGMGVDQYNKIAPSDGELKESLSREIINLNI